ncbi:hypothetical protein ACP4OV_029004 [Aristida adscensionis]
MVRSWWALLAAVSSVVFPSTDESQSSDEDKPSSTTIARSALAYGLLGIQVVVFAFMLCPLLVIYVLGLYVSTGISMWRLMEHKYGNKVTGEAKLMSPALDILYSLAVAQGILFGYRQLYYFAVRFRVAKEVANSDMLEYDVVLDYVKDTISGCDKDPSFAKGRNYVTHAVDLLMQSKSHERYLYGVQILGKLIESPSTDSGTLVLIKQQVTGSASFVHMVQRLLETLGPRSPCGSEIRTHAAAILAHIAGSIRLEQFPGRIQYISSLLDTSEQYVWKPEGSERHRRLRKEYERDWLLEKYERDWQLEELNKKEGDKINKQKQKRQVPDNVSKPREGDNDNTNKKQKGQVPVPDNVSKPREGDDSDLDQGCVGLVIQGLRILQRLAVDDDNCRIIGSTQGLLSMAMAPLLSDKLHREHHEDWGSMAEESMELLSRLMASPGVKLRCEMSSNREAITSTLRCIILECTECGVLLKRRAIEILQDLPVDTSSIVMASGSSSNKLLIWMRLHVLLLPDHHLGKMCGSIHWAKKSSAIRTSAHEKLSAIMLPLQSERNATFSQLVRFVLGDLTGTLLDSGNYTYRLQAAQILEHLCCHYTEDDEYLKELKKAMVDAMPKVLNLIFDYESTGEAIPDTDIEHGDEKHEGIKLFKEALRSLCSGILSTWVDEDSDLTRQLNEIAKKVCLERKRSIKSFEDLIEAEIG